MKSKPNGSLVRLARRFREEKARKAADRDAIRHMQCNGCTYEGLDDLGCESCARGLLCRLTSLLEQMRQSVDRWQDKAKYPPVPSSERDD